MSAVLSTKEREDVLSFVQEVVKATVQTAAPHIIEMMASTKPNIRYTRCGDQCVIEPVDPFAGLELTTGTLVTGEEFQPIGVRDYRKQLWIESYAIALRDNRFVDGPKAVADAAVREFDKAFPK